MRHFVCYDDETGEEFLVGVECDGSGEDAFEKALAIAEQYFDCPEVEFEVSDYEAELTGLDEY